MQVNSVSLINLIVPVFKKKYQVIIFSLHGSLLVYDNLS